MPDRSQSRASEEMCDFILEAEAAALADPDRLLTEFMGR